MPLLTISIALNIYLVLGILIYGINTTGILHAKMILQNRKVIYSLYNIAVILFWPISPYLRWVITERYSSYK